jgi:uncharacterized protein (DUF952 family)
MPDMRIFHIATLADWKQAQETGSYTTSTYGRTLEEEGFIHAARDFQVPLVRDRFYADVAEPLVVLEVETDLLDAEVRDEQVGDEVYPHVYGPIPTSAVVAWRPARLPPIELGTTRRTVVAAPPLTTAFRGLALVLAAGAVALFIAAVLAQGQSDDGTLDDVVPFVLWSMTAALAASTLAAIGYGEWLRRQVRADG